MNGSTRVESVDVLIVGAGISGIDMAYRVQTMCTGLTYAVIESRADLGGTWDLFRYPGIRSDSDPFTLAFPFEPWPTDESIAGGPRIRQYLQDTADKYDITPRIRFNHTVIGASWSTDDGVWTVRVNTPDGEREITARWIHAATGYYDYDAGYTPEFPGRETFAGTWIHPQHWPQDLDVTGRRIAVIGSGATAMTLVPALADDGAHVTIVQRSPTYVLDRPRTDPLAGLLRRTLGAERAHRIVRAKNVRMTRALYKMSRRAPKLSGRVLRGLAQRAVAPAGVDPVHFTPRYNPWDQRLCVIPDGDLFRVLREGTAAIVTDTIAGIEPSGIRLGSGELVEADLIVSATGLVLRAAGGIPLTIDGEPVDLPSRHLYRGVMLSQVPNLTLSIGYINASWTLRADLAAQYSCRLINRTYALGANRAYPVAPEGMASRPALDLTSGYVQRAANSFPRQGDRAPWVVEQDYLHDRKEIAAADLSTDMVFEQAARPRTQAPQQAEWGRAATAPVATKRPDRRRPGRSR